MRAPVVSALAVLGAALILTLDLAARGAEAPAEAPDTDRWEKDIAAFEAADQAAPPAPGGVLFTGSSTIRMWDLKADFPDLPAANRGFGGSAYADLDRHIGRIVAAHRPRTVVVYSGDNDIASGGAPEKVFQDFASFAAKLHALRPDARLLVFSTKPSTARWDKWPAIQDLNARVAKWCGETAWAEYVDTVPVSLGPDGLPRKDLLLKDGLHLNREGYRLWAEVLRRNNP